MEQRDLKTVVAQVKSAYDLVDYVRSAGLELQSGGVGTWKARCPFHVEKTPSFTVNENFQNYRCWGCGASGDLLSYVSATENLSFFDALKKLASDKGIELDLDDGEQRVDYESHQRLMRLAANFYCKQFDQLPEEHVAKTEISKRNLTYGNQRPEWLRYGYSPEGNQLYHHLSKAGFSDELILESGLCRRSSKNKSIYDFFRRRLMFVFTDRYGKPVGFSSRKVMEDDVRGKYVNSSESPLFHKSRVLYNHAIARKAAGKTKRIFICEGQFDVAAFVEDGLPEAVATSGTAFTREHVIEVRKMIGDQGRFIFCFDGDEAGATAASKVFLNFPEIHEDAYVVVFPGDADKDPSDYLLHHGKGSLQKYVDEHQVSLVEFMVARVKDKHDLSSPVGKAKYVEECARLIKSMNNAALQEAMQRMISLESFTSLDSVRTAVEQAEPLTQVKPIENDAPEEPEDRVAVQAEPTQAEIVQKLRELLEQDKYYDLAARFISLGLLKKPWRASLVRSRRLLPEEFHELLDDLAAHSEVEHVFPEIFRNSELASLLMSTKYSTFYKFMTLPELREQFIYLHERLQKYLLDQEREEERNRIREMLASDEENSVEYLRELLSRHAHQQEHPLSTEASV